MFDSCIEGSWGLTPQGRWVSSALACASYLTGMKIPGKPALMRRLRLDINTDFNFDREAVTYSLSKTRSRYGLCETTWLIGRGASAGAHCAIEAFELPLITKAPTKWAPERLPAHESPQSAIVIGGGSGFGFSASVHLARKGVCTHAISRRPPSPELKETLSQMNAMGTVLTYSECDATNFHHLREVLVRELHSGRVDYLLLCATGALRPMKLENTFLARICEYMRNEISLVLNPLEAIAPYLHSTSQVILASSSALNETQDKYDIMSRFPQYLFAKRAIEDVVHSYPVVGQVKVLRLPAMNTALLFRNHFDAALASDPDDVARTVVEELFENAREHPTDDSN